MMGFIILCLGEFLMSFSYEFKKKNKILSRTILCSLVFLCSNKSNASTSLMASGHAGLVGQYSFASPPASSSYHGWRVPIGLTLTASPTDNLNLYLGLDYAYSYYPVPPTLLGNTTATTTTNSNGTSIPMPFANATNGSTYSQKLDTPTLTQAYFSYQTPLGLLRAGRMPRNWGMGVWLSDEWIPYGGTISTSDAMALTADFNLFDVTAYYEKYGESIGATSNDGEANAYTIEARLKNDPADPPSSGISREVGVIFSRFTHSQSNTTLSVLDGYEKFYFDKFFAGGEMLYVTGSTQNPNYQSLGGAPACAVNLPGVTQGAQTCITQQVSSIAALLKLKYQLNASGDASIAATEKSQQELGTSLRQLTHTFGLWAGYASGGQNQFTASNALPSSNNITAIAMNPNIQPSFLMFNNTLPPVNGMPMGAVTNASFIRADYTYETPDFGAMGPIITSAVLNQTNANFNGQNPICNGNASVSPGNPVNIVCTGGSRNLGTEVDMNYHYTTLDRVTLALDAGWWFVGTAWQVYGQSSVPNAYGFRASVSTVF